ncbi:MAG TPA: serine/threonine-protein kinase [Thermoanaerobaculia bacterium]|nr:serine/threonine-protein kinase [Thermoanaerobaculia bacterium]
MIDPEYQQRLETIFLRVVEAPPEERQAILERECAGDERLLRDVESLLAHDDGGGATAIRSLLSEEAASLAGNLEQRWIGRRIGAWKITGILGRGGMGAVYAVARDDGAFQQHAALKIVRADVDSEHGRRRFLEERQILAHLNHPNIARLLDGGETDDGVPFLVMEAVDGLPITEHCDAHNLPLHARLRLFAIVCRAVHFAHTQLIVHRDLKPSNILVTSDGTVKLLDFGIARLMTPGAAPLPPTLGELALTPDYASPEQLRAEPVTTSSDIYSLGTVLFEMLTGRKAHKFSSYTLPEFLRVVCETEALVPSEAAPGQARQLRGDLDHIVLNALRKEPLRRYASAEQLAEDIDRHLNGMPVTARPDSWRYRAGKFIRRNRLAVTAAALILLSLLAGIAGTMWQARRAERRFAQVRQLANTFLFRFHDEIRELPGSTRARELVASTALEYLDNLAKDAQSDTTLQMELGTAYEKLGDVLGNPRESNLGRTDEALSSLEKSLRLRIAASGAAVDNETEGRAVMQSHIKLADVLLNAGKTDESQPHVDAALALAMRYGTTQHRAVAHSRVGELALRRGDLVATESAYRVALAEAQRATVEAPTPDSPLVVLSAASRLGYVLKMASRQKEALAALDAALQAAERLHAAEPSRTAYVRHMMNIHNDRGDTLRSPFAAEGMYPKLSLKEHEEALKHAMWIANADPNEHAARVGILFAKAQIADVWRELDPARSLPLFEALFADTDALLRNDPSNFQMQWLAAVLRVAYADASRAAGHPEALRRYDDAVARIEKMRESDRGRSISRRDLTKVLAERGALRLSRNDVTGAAADAAACTAQAATFVTADARPMDLRDIATCYELAGDVAARTRQPQEAVRHFDEALVRWREFGQRKLDSAFLRERKAAAEQRRTAALAMQ